MRVSRIQNHKSTHLQNAFKWLPKKNNSLKFWFVNTLKYDLHSWSPVKNPRHDLSVAAVETWGHETVMMKQRNGHLLEPWTNQEIPDWACGGKYFDFCGVNGWHTPDGGLASVRREWMSSTASVSSIYVNDRKQQEIQSSCRIYSHSLLFCS